METNNQIAKRDDINLPALMGQAEILLKSGFLPSAIKTPAQAVAIIITGRELGLPAMQSLRQINVIQGKPTMSAELMLSLAYQRIPGFKYSLVESTAESCTCEFERPGHKSYRHTFTMADAKGMGLDSRDNWHKQPAVMLRWRCISAGLRLIAPDAIAGVYTPEELAPDSKMDFNSGEVKEIMVANDKDDLPGLPEVETPTTKEKFELDPQGDNHKHGDGVVRDSFEYISEKQQKRLFAITKAQNLAIDDLKNYLKAKGIGHSKDILKRDYDKICQWVQNGGQDTVTDGNNEGTYSDPDHRRKDVDASPDPF